MKVLCVVPYYGKERCGGKKPKKKKKESRLQREFKVSPGNFVKLCLQKSKQV